MTKPVERVTFVSHSDLWGGAGLVTFRLMEALRAKGVDARMVVYTKISDSPYVSTISSRFVRGLVFTAERARIFAANGFSRDDLFKVSIGRPGMPLWRHPWIRRADVVNLGWINQGLLSLGGIRRIAALGKPLVWTMHDMWCMTGICHHAGRCNRFAGECGLCPLLHSRKPNDLSHKTLISKQRLYTKAPIRFVAVSRWLAERAASSLLMRDLPVEVIPNAFPIDSFPTESTMGLPPELSSLRGRRLIVMGAARLDDPIKGFDDAIDVLNRLHAKAPQLADKVGVVFFGTLRNPAPLATLRFPHVHLGRIEDPMLLRNVYASADVVLSTSKYETLPGTLIEGQAAGCLPVTFGRGGQADIVTHLKDGYIARNDDVADLVDGLLWALSADVDRRALHDSIGARFDASVIADRYLKLYASMLT